MIRLRMPFDLDSMLSSSPPGFELNLDIRNSFVRADEQAAERSKLQFATKARWYALDRTANEEPDENVVKASDSESEQGQSSWLNEETSRRISNWESYYDCDPSMLDCAAEEPTVGFSRKVSFADRLESVLVIEEAPDEPPWALCHDTADEESVGDVALDEPRLVLNFTQPAADYLTFRTTVEMQFVSLANVIVKNYRVSGTVRVKNITFEKSVVVRYSLDGWMNFNDAVATHQADDDERFDTFAFVVDCPPNLPSGSKLQFAVRYTAGGVDYWDSNRGENFEVLYLAENSAKNYRPFQTPAVFSGHPSSLWSEYSGWSDIDITSPYW